MSKNMSSYFLFGTYSEKAIKGVSAARTKKVNDTVKKLGGKVISIYALFGEHDLVVIVELPSMEKAIQLSTSLFKLTGISFSTHPAFEVKAFDKLVGKK